MAFAAGMMLMATSQHIKGHAENAMPALPKEALTEAEIKRWVVKPGQSVPEIVRPPLGSNVSIEGYQSSEMELTWLTGNIARNVRKKEKKTLRSRQKACDHRESANLGRVFKSTRRVGA